MAKSFLPEVGNGIGVSETTIHRWVSLKEPETFIDNLVTSYGNTEASQNTFNDLISGVPSPWARAKMTAYALGARTSRRDERSLMLCYKALKDEWRGLIATYVLKPDDFYLSEPISLKEMKKTDRDEYTFGLAATYGEMLFEEKSLWKHETDPQTPAYMQLLYYKDKSGAYKLVGATSPYTIFFTSVNYEIDDDMPWLINGKFTDPAAADANKVEAYSHNALVKIYSFLSMLSTNKESYTNLLTEINGGNKKVPQEISATLETEIKEWRAEIASVLGMNEDAIETVPLSIKSAVTPQGPIAKLFATNTQYWWKGGVFYRKAVDDAKLVEDISELLLPGNYLVGWMAVGNEQQYEHSAVYYLKARDEDSDATYYFSLPLSDKALDIMGSLNDIVNGSHDSKVRLRARVKGQTVDIVLEAKLGDSDEFVEILMKNYEIIAPESNGKVFVWPNFRSEYWKQYFYYSEFPTNMPGGTRMIPEFEGKTFEKDYMGDEASRSKLEEKMFLVRYPVDKASGGMWPYEIIKSDTPVKYVSIHVRRNENDWTAGRLIIKTPGGNSDALLFNDSEYMRLLTREPQMLQEATVGIDFGSTNTCAYYRAKGARDAEPVPFTNRRLALVGFDNAPRAMAAKDELLFISNEEPINKNGQIKSWLHEHEIEYVRTKLSKEDEPIIGGVPVNETNITVHSMDDSIITTNAGRLNYNMKWATGEGNKKRRSFISMVWLQICADLFANEMRPTELRWSFPSAMSNKSHLSQVFKNLGAKLNETIQGLRISSSRIKAFTEAEAVCKYAQSGRAALSETNLFLGIDIGGSTSDILILGVDPTDTKGSGKRLYSQCSVRIAAGFFFDAINRSEQFRRCLYNFHESHKTKVKVINIADVTSTDRNTYSRAPYYLNNVFDQLSGREEFSAFYDYMRSDIPTVFSLPAYITGLLSFYAGILLRETITKNNLNDINEIHFRYYGKGGRLFEWLFFTFDEDGKDVKRYLRKCLKAGLAMDDVKVKVKFDNLDSDDIEDMRENKSEVAKGLVKLSSDPNDMILGIYDHNDDDDDDDDDDTPSTKVNIERHEVVGEKGIFYRGANGKEELSELEVLEEDKFNNISRFDFTSSKFENFNKFIELFCDFVEENGFADNTSALRRGTEELSNLASFFENDGEREMQVAYRMPIFIASGLYYLNNVLLPQLFKKNS